MTRLNAWLLLALIASSVYLVNVAHESRRLFGELDKAQLEERLLEAERERLQAEKQSQATPLRVEKTAHDKLAMVAATPAVTRYVTRDGTGDAADSSRTPARAAEAKP